ncbi:MAG: TRAP transporter TatT component family protein, partial [Bdellovibrionota bacterium]
MGFCARMLPLSVLLGTLMLLGAGCATSRTSGWEKGSEQVTLSDKDKKELEGKAQVHWSKRYVKEDLLKFIDAYETLSKAEQNNYKYLVALCRGYYLLADGHTADIEQKKLLWEKGVTFGERAMATNPAFKAKVVAEEGKVEAALDTLTKNEVEAIYWSAVNLGKWGRAAGIATVLKYKTRIKEMINRVGALEPTFFYGAVERYWGAY